ncbi:unnamed protein product [Timema podura]|uniref:Uncharacterized protein n=1 Tax=Timema podura TaxID=61482 RepID=A0ABN7P7H1_TIMPD|nr:unnamed protein product [Timema podura]
MHSCWRQSSQSKVIQLYNLSVCVTRVEKSCCDVFTSAMFVSFPIQNHVIQIRTILYCTVPILLLLYQTIQYSATVLIVFDIVL